MEIGFSIVICTHNGTSRLEPTLAHIAALEMADGIPVELILVDNASTDDTAAFTRQYWVKSGAPFPLVVLQEKRPGKGYAVETGYDAARFSYILTVDDDNWLRADYLVNALRLLRQDPMIGALQGHNSGVFQTPPPVWFDNVKKYFILGGPKEEVGYFPPNDFFVWGAGMVIMQADWIQLRSLGYSALTSKLPGKAAGEDNELAIGLLLLGRKIYYSDTLCYQHYMPAGRVNWEKLRQNFDTFGYVHYYFFLYGLAINAACNVSSITNASIKKSFLAFWVRKLNDFTLKHHIAYWLLPKQESYQLHLYYHFAQLKWFWRLKKGAKEDIAFICSWMGPLLKENPDGLKWPL